MSELPEPSGRSALLTGITGQDGSYLAELLLDRGYHVWGLVRRASTMNRGRIDHLLGGEAGCSERLRLVYGDLGDGGSLATLIERIRPDEIYNLAAQSHVGVSFEIPEYTCDVNALGTVRLLDAMRAQAPEARFYQASSSEMYGKAEETPQSETTRFHPRSPYAASKVFAFEITRNYREAYGLFAVNGILFNHESPRRGENFVTRKITLAAARIATGQQESLALGNLEAKRDWGFAGDYVDAMWRMLQQDEPDDYVVATGKTQSVRDFCERAFERVGLQLTWSGSGTEETGSAPDGRTLVRIDPRFHRPAEVDLLLGDAGKARRELGWEPSVDFEGLVDLMVDSDLRSARVTA